MNHAEKVKELLGLYVLGQVKATQLIAAIDEMQAELDTFRTQVPELRGQVQRMEHVLREKGAEIERLSKDAGRYRWLRSNPHWLGWDRDFRPDEVEREVYKAMEALQKEALPPEHQARGDMTQDIKYKPTWEERFWWLADQHWVCEEVIHRLGLSNEDDGSFYTRELVEAIDARIHAAEHADANNQRLVG